MDHTENVNNQAKQASSPSLLVTRVVPLMIALQILLTLLISPFLPNSIPSRWNDTGPNASYEPKWIYVGFMPIFSILLYLFVLGLLTFVVNKKPNSQDMSAKKNEISRSILLFMMIMQQRIFFVTQVILLIVTLREGSGAIH
jgi:uncharacterized membrane protein